MCVTYNGVKSSNNNLRSLILRKKGKGRGSDRTKGDSMWDEKRMTGLGGPGYTTGGDTMEVKGFMDHEFTNNSWKVVSMRGFGPVV